MCVLLVEDNEVLRKCLAELLRAEGFEVESAPNGFKALELAAEIAHDLTLVVSDVRMPGMSGIEMWEVMRALVPSNCKVLFVTGDADIASTSRQHPLLLKPFSPKQLSERLFSMLNSSDGPMDPAKGL